MKKSVELLALSTRLKIPKPLNCPHFRYSSLEPILPHHNNCLTLDAGGVDGRESTGNTGRDQRGASGVRSTVAERGIWKRRLSNPAQTGGATIAEFAPKATRADQLPYRTRGCIRRIHHTANYHGLFVNQGVFPVPDLATTLRCSGHFCQVQCTARCALLRPRMGRQAPASFMSSSASPGPSGPTNGG